MKKIIVFFLSFTFVIMSFTAVFADSSPVISLGSASSTAGMTVDIPLVLSGNTGFMNLNIEIGYDSNALRLINVVTEKRIGAGLSGSEEDYSANPYNMNFNSTRNIGYNGTLATLTFEIITDEVGTYKVTVDYYKGRDGNYIDGKSANYDENFQPINLKYSSGSVTLIAEDNNVLIEEKIIPKVEEDSSGTEGDEEKKFSVELEIELEGKVFTGRVYAIIYSADNKFKSLRLLSASKNIDFELKDVSKDDHIEIIWWKNDLKPMFDPISIFMR